MARISHPEDPTRDIEVEILARESHYGNEALQVQSLEDGIDLTDLSGEPPWVPAEDVEE